MPQAKRSTSSQAKKSTSSSRTRRGSGSSASSSRSRNGRNGHSDEEMYRRAAEDALQQLDWAIGYLHGINKTEISKALSKNRGYIRKRMLGEPEEPLPTEQTNET